MPDETAEWDDARRRALCERTRAYHRERDIPFDYPPATEAQLRATEEQLGFPLPPMLRLLYGEVANGGCILNEYRLSNFIGAEGGCPHSYIYHCPFTLTKAEDGTVEELVSRSGWRLHDCLAEALKQRPRYYVLCDEAPDGFLPFHKCGPYTSLYDTWTGSVYAAERDFESPPFEIPVGDEESIRLVAFSFQASSVEDWFERLFDGKVPQGCLPGHALTSEMIASTCTVDPQEIWRGLYRFGSEWDEEADAPEDDDWEYQWDGLPDDAE